jgi:hypothetical protein
MNHIFFCFSYQQFSLQIIDAMGSSEIAWVWCGWVIFGRGRAGSITRTTLYGFVLGWLYGKEVLPITCDDNDTAELGI